MSKEDNKEFRRKLYQRIPALWVGCLITFVVVITFTMTPVISGGTATALTAVTGMLSLVLGLYQKSFDEDKKRRRNGTTGTGNDIDKD